MKLKEYLKELNEYLESYPEAKDWEVVRHNYEALGEDNDDAILIFKRVNYGPIHTEILEEGKDQIQEMSTLDLQEKYGRSDEEIAIIAGFSGCTGPDVPNAIILC